MTISLTPTAYRLGNDTRPFYFEGNPWKLVTVEQRLFRCCITCGESRFSDEEWKIAPKSREVNLLICDKGDCNRRYFVEGGKHFLSTQNTLADDIYYKRADKEAFRSLFLYVDETRDSLLKKRDALQKAIKRCSTFYSGIFTLAITQLQLNRLPEAIELLEKLATQVPDDITVHYYLSELYLSRYNAPAAWASYQKAEALARKKKRHAPSTHTPQNHPLHPRTKTKLAG